MLAFRQEATTGVGPLQIVKKHNTYKGVFEILSSFLKTPRSRSFVRSSIRRPQSWNNNFYIADFITLEISKKNFCWIRLPIDLFSIFEIDENTVRLKPKSLSFCDRCQPFRPNIFADHHLPIAELVFKIVRGHYFSISERDSKIVNRKRRDRSWILYFEKPFSQGR